MNRLSTELFQRFKEIGINIDKECVVSVIAHINHSVYKKNISKKDCFTCARYSTYNTISGIIPDCELGHDNLEIDFDIYDSHEYESVMELVKEKGQCVDWLEACHYKKITHQMRLQ